MFENTLSQKQSNFTFTKASFPKSLLMLSVLYFCLPGTLLCQSLLWEISGNGLKDTSYLYGTMHVRDARVFGFGDSLWTRFNKSSAFAGEIILEGADKKALAKHLLLPKDTSLKMLIGKANYKKVKKLAKPQLGPFAMLINRIKPIYLSGLITEVPTKDGYSEPVDMYFQKKAKNLNKELIGLEEIEAQLRLMNMFPLKQQAEMLVASINNMDSTKLEMEQMMELYLKQDLEGLQQTVNEAGLSLEMSNAMLGERNTAMAEKISTLIVKQSIFIAVGAAHLGGKGGLIDLLKQRGFTL
ncbi:MAG TPA: TraB/GumN family protein, partial [Cytophagaceae bacterium]